MQTFDVTLNGFDGGTDETDHLVKWVDAPDEQTLEDWLRATGLYEHCQEQSPDGKRWMPITKMEFGEGLDVRVDDTVETFNGEPFNPQDWIEQSQLVLG
jgi:hypothetical protein